MKTITYLLTITASALLLPQFALAAETEEKIDTPAPAAEQEKAADPKVEPAKTGPQNQPAVVAELKDNEVIQGGIIRWKVEGATQCGMGGKSWPAVDGVAYFPIDMDEDPGRKTISVTANGTKKSKTITVVKKDYGQEAIELPTEPKEESAEDKKPGGHHYAANRFVDPSGEDLKQHWKDQDDVQKVIRGSGGAAKFNLPLAEPVDSLPASEPNFAVRRFFNTEGKNRHTGQDYNVGKGTEIKAMADGKVVLTGSHFFAGNSVYIDHGDGLVIMFFHLDEILAKAGQEVKKGDVVAKSGESGRGTGPHLHIGARWNNKRIDPKLLLASPDQLPSVKE